MTYLGIRAVGSTVYIPFTTHDTDGASVAPSSAFEAADVRVYKNGSATQRNTESGYTMTSPFDSVTGLHMVAIDLSDNTDASFYAAGSHYNVVLAPDETVDSLAVVRALASFDIGVAPANVTQWLGTAAATPTVAGVPEVDVTHVAGSTTDVSTIPASVAAILVDTGTTLDGKLDTIDNFLDTEVAAILADTGELQTDWANGGRLDLLIDAIKAKTDGLPSDPADASDIASLIDALPTAAENAAALMDLADGIETSITPRQAIRLILAASAGKLSGAATTTVTIRNVGDSKDRITATVDADGNRSAVTTDAT